MKERYKTAQAYMQKLRFLIEDVSEAGCDGANVNNWISLLP